MLDDETMNNTIKCCKCNKKDAVWFYIPGFDDGKDFFCDDCVPRGCGCNVYSLKELPLNKKEGQNYETRFKKAHGFSRGMN